MPGTRMRMLCLLGSLVVLMSCFTASPAQAASAPDRGRAWAPEPRSIPLYGTRAPDEDPEVQRAYVTAHDEVQIYVETWLPERVGDKVPPRRVPTILIMTPYVVQGAEAYPASGGMPGIISYFTARGFAVAQTHVRGTGESGGCLEQTARSQIDDGARVIEYLGRDAPWSNGKVGMFGASYDAETQISTAGFGPQGRLRYLKAIVPAASVGSQYDWNFMDGVPWTGQPLIGNTGYFAVTSMFPGRQPAPQHYPEKASCQQEIMMESANTTGDYTDYWEQREYRPGARRIRAATLMVHGLRDFNVQPITLAGFFDRLPASTPHKGLFGVWNHAFPNRHPSVEPEWARMDWLDMVTAWYDRYLKGLPTGVEDWPEVQVQASDGQWWEAPEFPTTGGPLGQLALGLKGRLGAPDPRGFSVFREPLTVASGLGGTAAVFETTPMKAPLHVTGQPVLDLWIRSSQPDAHIGVEMQVIGADGQPLVHEGTAGEAVATYGVRSMQHIAPMRRGWFEQERGKPLPVGRPVNVLIRFLPTDLVVPEGATLRLSVSGTVGYSKGSSLPSGAGATIEILHDCDHMSALRFRMPSPDADLLNVREPDELDRLRSKPAKVGRRDGAGLARTKVCGEKPRRVPFL